MKRRVLAIKAVNTAGTKDPGFRILFCEQGCIACESWGLGLKTQDNHFLITIQNKMKRVKRGQGIYTLNI